jgi:hemerythrin
LDLTGREEFQAEIEKSNTPFSMRDLERLKDDLDDLTRYSEKYFEEREALMSELEEVVSDLLSYGSPAR